MHFDTLDELCFYPAYKLRQMILDQQISSKELLTSFFGRIKRENPHLHALISIREERVWQEFEKCAALPLLALPVVIEDSIQIANEPTTYGSLLMKEFISTSDDLEVKRLKEGGAAILGKSNLSEFGFSPQTLNRLGQATLNPLTEKVCLGSSGGAAASVAAGFALFAIGTDTTGGVRLPAYDCGLFGLKPTRGRIPLCREHIVPMSEKLFHQKGLIARDPRDIALLLHILAQPDPHDLDCCCIPPVDYFERFLDKKPQKLKIGYSYNLGFLPIGSKEFETMQSFLKQLEKEGHEIIEIACQFEEELFSYFKSILACDRYFPLLSLQEDHGDFSQLLDYCTSKWFRLAHSISGIDYAGGLFYAQWVREEVEAFFESVDLIITPCMPSESLDPLLGEWGFLLPFNLSGHPALTTPSGIQVVGKYFDEMRLLRFCGRD